MIIDVPQFKKEDGSYELPSFDSKNEYRDSTKSNMHLWSIGRCKSTGKIFGSFSAHYFQNEEYECLYYHQ